MTPDRLDHAVRVLIVDEDPKALEILRAMLAPEDYVILLATSGEEALGMVAATDNPPDIILLDVRLLNMDGNEVASRIKANPDTQNIPIIMISALEDRESRMRGLTAGAEEFLTKPVDRAELSVRIRNLLRLKAYGAYVDKYSQMLEGDVRSRTADLRHERDRAQRYLDTAETILLAVDLRCRVTLVNRYACAVLGWSADELVGRDFAETCIPAAIRAVMVEKFSRIVAGDLSIAENAVQTKSGEERLIEWHNTLLRDDAGNVTGLFSCGTDITERTKANEALRTAEESMRFAVENADIGIWDWDCATDVLRWSDTVEAHYGLPPGTFGGTFEAYIDRVHPEDRQSVRDTIRDATASGADFTTQNRTIWPDGTLHWLSGSGRILRDADGLPKRGIGISLDVTERRTRERQTQQTQKMEAIGQLASGVAHDFNNLLTVILGFSEILAADTAIGAQHKMDLEEIIKAARRASGLTRQLLTFSRQQVVKSELLDVNSVIADMAGMLERLIGEDMEVALALSSTAMPILADRSQVEQVVMNLVVNARDAMPGGGRVTIETMQVDLQDSAFHEETVVPGPYVMIGVADTGTGMTAETQRHIFEPFFTTKPTGRGTGLGLSTVYGIVKQSDGHIWVYSEPGLGTTFKVYFPRSSDVAVHAPRTWTAPPAARAAETVLLVEDEAGVRQLSKRILDRAGYRVLEAGNGDDAEQVFLRHQDTIDLVLTDVIMPGCGGPELLRRLQVRVPALRVLYMSGYTEQSVARQAAIDHGPFVQKPFTAAELVRQVRDTLDAPR